MADSMRQAGGSSETPTTLIVPASLDELRHVKAFVNDELKRWECPSRTIKQIVISVEELFVNVARYAYPDATTEEPGMVQVSCTVNDDPPSAVVVIADRGIPYNPLEKPDAVMPDSVEDAPVGGLGILMVKRSMDEMLYDREDGGNVVTIVKRW